MTLRFAYKRVFVYMQLGYMQAILPVPSTCIYPSSTVLCLVHYLLEIHSFILLLSQAISLGLSSLGDIFANVTVFIFNLTIEVVTFRLRGWCMLGVFLLPAFTCLAHECQDSSPCDGMHVCTD